MRLFLALGMGLLVSTAMQAQPASLVQTKQKIQHLNQKIVALKQQLISAEASHQEVDKVVSNQDKKMNDVKTRLGNLTLLIDKRQASINQLSKKENDLKNQLHSQQEALADYVRMRYRLGKDFTLKAVVNIDSIQHLQQGLVYSQYIISSHKQLIAGIKQTQAQLSHTESQLKHDLIVQSNLKTQLNKEYAKLAQDKQSKLTVLSQLVSNIKTHQQVLSDYERDKNNLNILLETLVKEAKASQSRRASFSPQFSSPHKTGSASTIPWNQGLLFLAPEGSAVKAIQAGKVVFSDWLRGYGFLVIIDHGQGSMTLYGYNHSLYKHQGERVEAGEQIATVGHSGMYRESGVYFEVRRQGKIVSARGFINKNPTLSFLVPLGIKRK